MLKNKRILLGVSGGIAAYKSAELVRELQRLGATVRVVMTKAACEFITPITLQALSGYPVRTELFDESAESAMSHIELARWPDLILIAPASADLLAKLAAGIADELLTALCLVTSAKVFLAPAMNRVMWQHSQETVSLLTSRGYWHVGVDAGYQACGEVGEGRLLAIEDIVAAVTHYFQNDQLSGQHVVITAGPTREYIDPIRYLSNASSGKMGYALAEAALSAGAAVTLITGPVALTPPARATVIAVTSAEEMYQASLSVSCDIFIGVAAVADYRPVVCADKKIKKGAQTVTLELTSTPDILKAISLKQERPYCVGFAAETHEGLAFAKQKLIEKSLDMIVMNEVGQPDTGFESDENAVTILWKTGEEVFSRQTKTTLARRVMNCIIQHYRKSRHE